MKTRIKITIMFFILSSCLALMAQENASLTREENVTFSRAGAIYSGTLTLPAKEGNYPLLILVSGMGPQNRDWKFGSVYKMAKIIADSLAIRNIAVYRYDDRGVGESTGVVETLTCFDTLAEDVYAAVTTLRQRKDIGKIGLCGHSLGGILSVMAASSHHDIDFIITLSGSFRNGGEIMMEQARTLKRWKTSDEMTDGQVIANGEKFVRNWESYSSGGSGLDTMKMILNDLIHYQVRRLSPEKLAENLKTFKDTNDLFEKSYQDVLGFYTSPHQKSFAVYDPVTSFPKITCPVLVMFGEKDAHVVFESNRPALVKALLQAQTPDFSYKVIPGVDHGYSTKELYKKGQMGPGVIEFISSWILTRFSTASTGTNVIDITSK
jgi:hypothetical protein